MKRQIWLDLELKGDIDDILVLLYCLDNNINITAISILNPIKEEIMFINYFIAKYDKNIPIIVHCDDNIKNRNSYHKLIFKYQKELDDKSLLHINNGNYNFVIYENQINTFNLSRLSKNDIIVFGGGSYTIPYILSDLGFKKFYLQGGYAGSNIVEDKYLIDKFKNKTSNRTWNPFLDINSTKKLISNKNISIFFISKNICHQLGVNIDLVKEWKNSEYKSFMLEYLNNSNKFKKIHDLIAFLSIYYDFIDFLPVDIIIKENKFSSIINYHSNINISVNWNKETFLNLL